MATSVIKVVCPSCGKAYKVSSTSRGKSFACKECGKRFTAHAAPPDPPQPNIQASVVRSHPDTKPIEPARNYKWARVYVLVLKIIGFLLLGLAVMMLATAVIGGLSFGLRFGIQEAIAAPIGSLFGSLVFAIPVAILGFLFLCGSEFLECSLDTAVDTNIMRQIAEAQRLDG